MRRIGVLAGLMLLALPALAAEPAKPREYLDPREVRAQQDMLTLAQQEVLCEAQTTYLVALEALNDSRSDFTTQPWDYINYGGGSYALRRALGSFSSARVNFLTGINQWQGPYITFQSGTTWQTGNPLPPEGVDYDQGSPLDPWGTPYYFFSPLGLIHGDTGKVTLELYGDAFGTYTIVSLGPDGIMSADDMAYSLGVGVDVAVLTSLRGSGVTQDTTNTSGTSPSGKPGKPLASLTNSYESSFLAEAGTTVTLRGQNLGQATTNAKVTFNGNPIDTVTSWTARAITFTLPDSLGGQKGTLAIQRGTWSSNALKVTINAPPPTAARGWTRYE